MGGGGFAGGWRVGPPLARPLPSLPILYTKRQFSHSVLVIKGKCAVPSIIEKLTTRKHAAADKHFKIQMGQGHFQNGKPGDMPMILGVPFRMKDGQGNFIDVLARC